MQERKNKKLYIPIHIPKTGGTTIQTLVFETNEQLKNNLDPPHKCNVYYPFQHVHIPVNKIREKITKKKYPNIDTFAIIRNPYTRIYSLWKFIRFKRLHGEVASDFNIFVSEYCSGKYKNVQFFESQLFFLKGDEDIRIFKLEKMDILKEFLTKECNVIWKDLQSNQTMGPPHYKMYDETSIRLIKYYLKEEFEILNYSKNFDLS